MVSSFEKLQLKSLSEGLGAIRDILLNGSQKIYYEGYKKTDKLLRLSIAQSQFLANFPRFTFETLGLLVICFLSYTLSINSDENLTIIPVLGTFALGAQRLLPALQQMYGAWAGIRSQSFSVKAVFVQLNQGLRESSFSRYKTT